MEKRSDPGAGKETGGLSSHELKVRGRHSGFRGPENQHPLPRRVVQVRPGHLDLDQLPQAVRAEVVNGTLIARHGRVHPELAVEARPGEPQRTLERERPAGEPQVEIETQRRASEGFEDVHVERHGMADDLLEELLAQLYPALPQRALMWLLRVPPELGAAGQRCIDAGRDLSIFVGQLDMSVEEPLHLVVNSRALASSSSTDGGQVQLAHELGERGAQEQLAAMGADRFGRDPGQQQAGETAEGQAGFPDGGHDQGVGAVDPLVLQPAAGVGAGQGAERHQPRHEAEIGVRFAGPDQLVHLIEAGEVAPRLG